MTISKSRYPHHPSDSPKVTELKRLFSELTDFITEQMDEVPAEKFPYVLRYYSIVTDNLETAYLYAIRGLVSYEKPSIDLPAEPN